MVQAVGLGRRQAGFVLLEPFIMVGGGVQQAVLQGGFERVQRFQELLVGFFGGCRLLGRTAIPGWFLFVWRASRTLPCRRRCRAGIGRLGRQRCCVRNSLNLSLRDGFQRLARRGQRGAGLFQRLGIIAQQVLGQCRVFRGLLIPGQRGGVARQRLRRLLGRLLAELADGIHGVDDGALQIDLGFQPGGQRGARGLVRRRQRRHLGHDLPLAIQFGHLVGRQLLVLQQAVGLIQARLGLLLLRLLITDGVQAALHQLGHAAVGVAHRLQHLFQVGLGPHMLGRAQAHAGKFAVQDQLDGGCFVAVQDSGALRLLVTAAGRCGGGNVLLRCRRPCLRVARLVACTLKEEIEHGALCDG
jgi:hypothetical protein